MSHISIERTRNTYIILGWLTFAYTLCSSAVM